MKNLNFSLLLTALWALGLNAFAQGDIIWKRNFGGSDLDGFYYVVKVPDGIVGIGASYGQSLGTGDWTGVTGNGNDDAIIVKYDDSGNVVWKRNFGGSGIEEFYSGTAVPDGVVVVGYSAAESFGNGDWTGVTGKGESDAIIIKYDNNGNVVWRKNFGGNDRDEFFSVTTVPDGVVAVGYSYSRSFGNGDWVGVTEKGSGDCIIVKYDNDGNVIWKKNFGGSVNNYYYCVTAVSDGIIAAGESDLDGGDWGDEVGNGSLDAIIVKYDNDGNVVWKKNFGGSSWDVFRSLMAVPDGIIAVGGADEESFGNGDWADVAGKGGSDAIIVKYDNNGNVVWKKNFGGSSWDEFYSVAAVSDGIIAAGESFEESFSNGDWENITGKGEYDAIMVKYDNTGNILWKENFGGIANDWYNCITSAADVIYAAGASDGESFDTGDWTGVTGNGDMDAFIIKYGADRTNIPQLAPPTSGLTVYPNPANDKALISVPASLASPTIRIFDMTGKIAAAYPCTGATTTVDVSQLQPGIYFIEVAGKTGKLLIKR